MLAFDLETSGLDPRSDLITCAAACDPESDIQRVFFFARLDESGELVPMLDGAETFMAMLDAADRLCAFNGARFDLPFLQHQLGASPARVGAWRRKLHDVFEGCKLGLGVTFPLRDLLELNGLRRGRGPAGARGGLGPAGGVLPERYPGDAPGLQHAPDPAPSDARAVHGRAGHVPRDLRNAASVAVFKWNALGMATGAHLWCVSSWRELHKQ